MLELLPLVLADSGLPQDVNEKFFANVVLVWIRNAEGEISPAHERRFVFDLSSDFGLVLASLAEN
jgi:hypothetical protein